MKVSTMQLGSLVIFHVAVRAQEKASSRMELGFSYSYTHVNPGGAISSTNANGGDRHAEYNLLMPSHVSPPKKSRPVGRREATV
jgi:hypothetical protein